MSTKKLDLLNKDDWNEYLDGYCKMLSEQFADDEMKIASCQLILTANPETGEAYPGPGVFSVMTKFGGDNDQEVEEMKDHYAMMLRCLAVAGLAVGSVFVTEAWMAHRTQEEMESKGYVRPMDDPERKEAIIMMFQHKEFGTGMRTAFIEHEGKKRVVQDWEKNKGMQVGGRFVDLVPPDSALENADLVKLSRVVAIQERAAGRTIPLDDFIGGKGEL